MATFRVFLYQPIEGIRRFQGAFSTLLLLTVFLLIGCGGGSTGPTPPAPNPIRFSSEFESGSIGAVTPLGQDGLSWDLALRNDNDNSELPSSYRTWWLVRAEAVPIGKRVRLEFSRLGFREFFVPVYSYDGKRWQYFEERDVALVTEGPVASGTDRLRVDARFDASTVWIARTFPYTAADLSAYLQTLAASPFVRIDSLGPSPRFQLPIRMITINDSTIQTPKNTVWMHARSHPGETGPSYLLEGLIGAALGDDALGRSLRSRYIFKIVPMHNVDGVFLGNYRTNAGSLNLESSWLFTPGSVHLNANAPTENRLLNQYGMAPALLDGQAPVVLALNLHSSNSSPDTAAFFFPHFGDDPGRYTSAQRNLWRRQIDFIERVAIEYDGRIERPPAEGGAGFLDSAFPETWWWAHAQDAVNAITLETTYGRAGFDHWVTKDDLRSLGAAVARAIDGLGSTPAANGDPRRVGPVFRLPYKPEIYQERE